jgi:Protein of unknown function (DUF3551)
MRSTIPFLVAATLLGEIQAVSAQSPASYPWCARLRDDVTSCYFTSREQCMTTISGIGVYCYENPYHHSAPAEAPAVKRRATPR